MYLNFCVSTCISTCIFLSHPSCYSVTHLQKIYFNFCKCAFMCLYLNLYTICIHISFSIFSLLFWSLAAAPLPLHQPFTFYLSRSVFLFQSFVFVLQFIFSLILDPIMLSPLLLHKKTKTFYLKSLAFTVVGSAEEILKN